MFHVFHEKNLRQSVGGNERGMHSSLKHTEALLGSEEIVGIARSKLSAVQVLFWAGSMYPDERHPG